MKKLLAIVIMFSVVFTNYSSCCYALSKEESHPVGVFENSYRIVLQNDNKYLAIDRNSDMGYMVYRYQGFEYIYSTNDERLYYQKINNNDFVEVRKVTIRLLDPELKVKLESYGLEKNIVSDITKKARECDAVKNAEAEVVFFVDAQTRGSTWTTTTWAGRTFHNNIVDISNYWSPYKTLVPASATTLTFLSNLFSFIVGVAGLFSTEAGIFGVGISALQFYGGTPIYQNSANYIQTRLVGHWYTKYTYYYVLGTDFFGCETQFMYLTNIGVDEFLVDASTGNGVHKTNTISFIQGAYSPFYQNAEAQAFSVYTGSLSPYYDSLTINVSAGSYHTSFVFN